jgi:hypothetical protein
MFEYDSSAPGILRTRDFIDGMVTNTFRLRISKFRTEKAYSEQQPVLINVKNTDDIKKTTTFHS